MLNYVKIPREIIYSPSLTDKRVIIFAYLCARRSLDDTVAFSTTELCHWSALKPNYRDGKINQKYYTTLSLLSDLGYFTIHPDFEKLKEEKTNSTEYHLIHLNGEKFDVGGNYGIIYFDELQKILNFKEELKDREIDLARMSSAYILLLLSYIRVNMNHSPNKPQCCYRLFKTISEDIDLSERYIGRIVQILYELGIVANEEPLRIKYKQNGEDKYRTRPKVFADMRKFVFDDSRQKYIIDEEYSYIDEIQKQIMVLDDL